MQKVLSLGLALPFIALFGSILLVGCPGELESPDKFKTDGGAAGGSGCFDVPNDLFKKKCSTAGSCHGMVPAKPPALDLESPGVVDRLVGQPGSTTCPGTLVNPSDAEGSVLYKKLTTSPGCGSRMPLVPPFLDDSEIKCVKEWIESLPSGSGGGPGAGGMGGMGGMGVGGMGGMGGAMGGMGGMGGM